MVLKLCSLASALLLATLALACGAMAGEAMPKDFVYLRDIDLSIQQDMRYASADNFTGRPVPGYAAAECILAGKAAEALKAVQAELKPQGLSLRVYDCYRPKRAVAAFVAWAEEPDDAEAKQAYYPQLAKAQLFPGYIATRSGHSRGATLDVTLAPIGSMPAVDRNARRIACTKGRPDDDSLDMGTGFDCFDRRSNTAAPGLTAEQKRRRKLLLDVMTRHGFKNYAQEIWHYTFQPEPFPGTYFDFPIAPRPGGTP